MKHRLLAMAAISASLLVPPATFSWAQNNGGQGFVTEGLWKQYERIVNESHDWVDIDGVKVSPDLNLNSAVELERRLDDGYMFTVVDPASGKITAVSELN